MRFTKKRIRYGKAYWVGSKKKVKFTIYNLEDDKFYIVLITPENLSFNTLWTNLTFSSFEEATDWCESFTKIEDYN